MGSEMCIRDRFYGFFVSDNKSHDRVQEEIGRGESTTRLWAETLEGVTSPPNYIRQVAKFIHTTVFHARLYIVCVRHLTVICENTGFHSVHESMVRDCPVRFTFGLIKYVFLV